MGYPLALYVLHRAFHRLARHRVGFLVVLACSLIVVSALAATDHVALPQHSAELWIVHLPLGHEIDVQSTAGKWQVFWQAP